MGGIERLSQTVCPLVFASLSLARRVWRKENGIKEEKKDDEEEDEEGSIII